MLISKSDKTAQEVIISDLEIPKIKIKLEGKDIFTQYGISSIAMSIVVHQLKLLLIGYWH